MDNQSHPELIDESVFIAPGAVILGDVRIGAQSSVWYNAVLRGDTDTISIGPRTNVQDGAVHSRRCGDAVPDRRGRHDRTSRRGAWRARSKTTC